MGQLWELSFSSGDVLLHIFANLYHEHSVVPLSGKTSVSDGEIVSEFIASEISLTSTSLSANGCYSFKIPRVQSFINAAKTQQLIFPTSRLLKDILAHVMQETKSHTSSKKRHKGVLLELVRKNWGVTLSFRSDSKPLFSVSNGDVQT